MPFTVRVQNFQSITDATLVVDKFTTITGPNNTGKSAFLRAVQGLFRNTKGTDFVRRGATHCSVQITFEDGASVTWEKGKNVNRYRINSDDWLEKVSHGVPDSVVDVLRVRAVTIANTAWWPQVGEQFNGQVFLLDKPGSVLAEAISDVERVGKLNKALQVAESDRRKARATLKIRRSDEEKTQDKLVLFHGLDDVGKRIEGLEEMREQAVKVRGALVELLRLKEALNRERSVIEKLSGVDKVQLPEKESFSEVLEDLRLYQFLQKAKEDLESASREVRTLQNACEAFDAVDFAEDLEIQTEKTIQSVSALRQFQRNLQEAQRAVLSLSEEVRQATVELVDSQGELHEVLLEMPECPVCGADIQDREGLQHVH